MEHVNIIGLMPASRDWQDELGITYNPPPGAGLMACQGCGRACWIGPTQMTYLEKLKDSMRALCPVCIFKDCNRGDVVYTRSLGGDQNTQNQ